MRTNSSIQLAVPASKTSYLFILVSCLLHRSLTDALSTVIPSTSTSTAPNNLKTTPVVICPGFGNDQIDYLTPLSQPREFGLVSCLERRGFQPDRINIVPIQRSDWIRVAGGLLDIGFYTCKAQPTGGGCGWYVKRLKETIDRAYEESNGEKVLVIAHSAGGWLARAAMGDGTWCDEEGEEGVVRTSDRIKCLVTVGAIHRPPPDTSTCATRGALSYTEENYPGAFLKEEGISYVSVGGDAIVGNDDKDSPEISTDADEVYAIRGVGSSSRVAFTSYKAVGGEGSMTGDGVVPLSWTQLDGARQIQLDGVLHSINEAGTTLPTDRWYGSEGVIDRWLPTVLEEAGMTTKAAAVGGGLGLEFFQKWAKEKVEEAQNMFSS